MSRIVNYRDLGVTLVPAGDLARHELWLNAQPPLDATGEQEWPGYEVREDGRLLGVVARRELRYPFNYHDYREPGDDPNVLEPCPWMLLGADLTFRRYAGSMRAATERLILGISELVAGPDRGAEGDDEVEIETWATGEH